MNQNLRIKLLRDLQKNYVNSFGRPLPHHLRLVKDIYGRTAFPDDFIGGYRNIVLDCGEFAIGGSRCPVCMLQFLYSCLDDM